jgi:hypothetical protein
MSKTIKMLLENANLNPDDFLDEAVGWKKDGSSSVKRGNGVTMTVKEHPGPGVPIYVLYMDFKGKKYRLKGQKRKASDLYKIADRWIEAFGSGSVDLTRDWIVAKLKEDGRKGKAIEEQTVNKTINMMLENAGLDPREFDGELTENKAAAVMKRLHKFVDDNNDDILEAVGKNIGKMDELSMTSDRMEDPEATNDMIKVAYQEFQNIQQSMSRFSKAWDKWKKVKRKPIKPSYWD